MEAKIAYDNLRSRKLFTKEKRRVKFLIGFIFYKLIFTFCPFMENSVALVKPKLTVAEKKIINMVIDGLPSENSRRAYRRHLEEFFVWHASENRPELNKALINRYVKSLRGRKLSSSTINQKLSSIRVKSLQRVKMFHRIFTNYLCLLDLS